MAALIIIIVLACSGAWFPATLPPPCISNLRQRTRRSSAR